MDIAFCFEYDKQMVYLPVNPSSITIKSKGNNKSDEVVKLGDITILKARKLKETSIECFFPIDEDAPYVLTKGKFKGPQFYINFFEKIRKAKQPCLFAILGTKINFLASIEDFEYSLEAADDDYHYKLEIKEYRPYEAKVLKPAGSNNAKATTTKSRAASTNSSGFSVGDVITATGKYYYTSYGAEPHGTFPSNFAGKISHVVGDKNIAYRYHITTTSGGYRGWVSASQLKHK